MKIRAMIPNDFRTVQELHERFHSQFELPNFQVMLNAFVIEDESDENSDGSGRIILAGCVEKVAEALLVTNKDKSEIKIGRALVEAQEIATFTCRKFGIRDLYAFVDSDVYAKHLIQHGFVEGHRALKLRIP